MARFLKDRTKAKGQVPGALVFIGNQKMETPEIHLMQFDSEHLTEEQLPSVDTAKGRLKPEMVNWINIYGIHDVEMIRQLGADFGFPPLLLEDIVNTDQRPKYENHENFDVFILKMLHQQETTGKILAEQITIVLGENYVLTLQERKGDVFAPVRDRIRNGRGRIRSRGNDYLAYSLIDTVVDNYTILIENLGSSVEEMEDRIFTKQDRGIVEELYRYKTELNFLRKTIRPVKDLMTMLLKTESSFFSEKNLPFLKDLNDLVVQSAEAIELYNSLISDQLNIYNTNMGNRLNEVMKVLTIFASIFIPLTFIAGIYGMNFEYIPELKYRYAYLIFWIVILLIGGGLLVYFKRKKWF